TKIGELPEWLTEQFAKLSAGNCRVGSNPTLSAKPHFGIDSAGYRVPMQSGRSQVQILPRLKSKRSKNIEKLKSYTSGCSVARLSCPDAIGKVAGSNPAKVKK